MSKDANLNLPDGILQQYQRRYSVPTPSTSKNVFHKPPKPRRFSLSTFQDMKDISSRYVRSRVNRVLDSSGYTQYDQAKSSQMRRYSLYVDHNVKNNLGGDKVIRRCSFSDKREIITYDRNNKDCNGKNDINNNDDNNDNTNNCNIDSRKRTHSFSGLSRKMSSESYWDNKDLEEYQSHLSKIKPLPYSACEEQYWLCRRAKSVEPEDNFSTFPKCKYKLRGNGLIASEMSSAYGVQIQSYERSCSQNSNQSLTQVKFNNATEIDIRPHSKLSCHTVKKHSSQKYLPSSSSPGSDTKESVADLVTPALLMLHSSLKDDENFKYSFYNPAKQEGAFAVSPSATRTQRNSQDFGPGVTTGTKPCFNNKPRRISEINFEIIGNPSLHGSPNYSGRLKLCSFRSPSFGN